ncbi:DUF6089 family protein [Natronoflexus pectinivorans]|uniref:Flagellar motor protein MotB n=1 Tax=Natronoflexus pectinivorans TaxID=682526 RepID=A0A4R2GMH6_9BACT|nr:DUF6089 family protein [Natronoflexus pectinivorans]TCO10465.1 flagellar motor protein MotB [Natronoflexus pectinivorans]
MRIIIATIVCLLSLGNLFGQFRQTDQRVIEEHMRYSFEKPFNTWALTMAYGPVIMYTDIIDYSFLPTDRVDFGSSIILSKQLAPVVALDLQFYTGKMYGQNEEFYFTGNVHDVSLNGVLFINQLGPNPGPVNDRWNFYLKAGAGLNFFRSRLHFRENDEIVMEADFGVGSSRFMVHGYDPYEPEEKTDRQMEVIIPVSAGFQYRLNRNFDVGMETSMRFTNSDNLDNILTGSTNDRYWFTGVTLSYKIGRKDKRHMRWTYRGHGFDLFGRPVRDPVSDELSRLEEDIARYAENRPVKRDSITIMETLTRIYETVEVRSIFFDAGGEIQFDEEDLVLMAETVVLLKQNEGSFVQLYGYVDPSDRGDHKELSLKKCETIKEFMVTQLGADAETIEIIPRGSSDNLSERGISSPEIRKMANRRVDIVFRMR